MRLGAYYAEFVGTFIFLAVIRATSGNPLAIGAALAAAVFLTAGISGGNLNPAVSVMSYALGSLSAMDTLMYAAVQVAAGLAVAQFIPKLM
jgi:glycerol uptake facilitator-like aquaporin